MTDKIAKDFFTMFCRGRHDVYALRYTNLKTGKTGYYTQCYNRWDRSCHIQKRDGVRCKDCECKAYKPVTPSLIKEHLLGADPNGNDVVAIYPSVDLLSKEDDEDNLMRVCSKDIAAELLEMAIGDGTHLQGW